MSNLDLSRMHGNQYHPLSPEAALAGNGKVPRIRRDDEGHLLPDTQLAGPSVLVHRVDMEGGLAIDGLSGKVITPINERPDWSEGLAVANLAERHAFYQSRLGPDFARQRMFDNPIDFRDLGWVGVDASGEECEFSADSEYRMDVIAEATGTVRTDDLSEPANTEDVPGQSAYVLTDESHEQPRQQGEPGVHSETWEEKVRRAAEDSERALRTGTY